MIPDMKWACKSKPEKFDYNGLTVPSDRYGDLYDIKIGPLNLGDSQGRVDQAMWMASVEDGSVYLYKAVGSSWTGRTPMFVPEGTLTDLALGFDALGQAVVFYAVGTVLNLWYFNSQQGQLITTVISTNGRTPLVDFDRRANTNDSLSDVAIYYVENNSAYMRIQRDVYSIAYYTGVTQKGLRLLNSGMNVGNRYQITYSYTENYDGTNSIFKVLETDRPLIRDLFGNDMEIRFRIDKPVTRCVLEGGIEKAYLTEFPDEDVNLDLINTTWHHTIVSHAANGTSVSHESGAEIFCLSFYPSSNEVGNKYENIVLVLRGGGEQANYSEVYTPVNTYYAGVIPYSTLAEPADYILRFTHLGVTGNPAIESRRVEFLKNGVHIFNTTVYGSRSYGHDNTHVEDISRNTLKFGGSGAGTGLYCSYRDLFPAVFTNVSVKINDAEVLWPQGSNYNTQADSTPAGTKLKLIKNKDDPYFAFFPTSEWAFLVNAISFEQKEAAKQTIMDYLTEAVNP